MRDDMKERRVAIVHVGQKAVQALLKPVGKEYRVSETASELLDDARQAACLFGNASGAEEVEQKYVNMQMRFAELTSFVSTLEFHAGNTRDVVKKF